MIRDREEYQGLEENSTHPMVEVTELGRLGGFCLFSKFKSCQYATDREKGICECRIFNDFRQELSSIGSGGMIPYVFCCSWAGKVLVVPTVSNKLYYSLCRSRIPDHRHLAEAAKLNQVEASVTLDKWLQLPKFSTNYVNEVTIKLTKDLGEELSSETVQTLDMLSQLYRCPEIDIACYSGLDAVRSKRVPYSGLLRLEIESDKLDKGNVVRIVVEKIPGKKTKRDKSDDERFSIPIVGLVLRRDRATSDEHGVAIRAAFDKALLGSEVTTCNSKDVYFRTSSWSARARFYPATKNASIEKINEWMQSRTVLAPINVSLNLGHGTVQEFLLETLDLDGSDFLEWLEDFSNQEFLPLLESKRPILITAVINCMRRVFANVRRDHAGIALSRRREAIEKILRDAEQRSPLSPASDIWSTKEAEKELAKHLLNGTAPLLMNIVDYIEGTEILQTGRYDLVNNKKIEELLIESPEVVGRILLENTVKDKSADGGEDPLSLSDSEGKNVWKRYFDYCRTHHLEDLEVEMMEGLYNKFRSKTLKRYEDSFAEGLGIGFMNLTLATVSWEKMYDFLRRRRYRKYVVNSLLA